MKISTLKITTIFLALVLIGLQSCKNGTKTVDIDLSDAPESIVAMSEAMKIADFHGHESVSFDIVFKGKRKVRFQGRMSTMADGSSVMLDYKGPRKLLYNNGDLYTGAAPNNRQKDLYTLMNVQNSFIAPYRIINSDVTIEGIDPIKLRETEYPAAKLNFEGKDEKRVHDWNVLYIDPVDNSLAHMKYTLNVGLAERSASENEQNAKLISYRDYKVVQGIPIAHKWKIRSMNSQTDSIVSVGEAIISNVVFGHANSLYDPKQDILLLKYD